MESGSLEEQQFPSWWVWRRTGSPAATLMFGIQSGKHYTFLKKAEIDLSIIYDCKEFFGNGSPKDHQRKRSCDLAPSADRKLAPTGDGGEDEILQSGQVGSRMEGCQTGGGEEQPVINSV